MYRPGERWLARLALALSVGVLLSLPAGAQAQDATDVETRRGFEVGSYRFHLGTSLDMGYDSNLFYEDVDELTTEQSLTDVFLMTIGVAARLETLPAEGLSSTPTPIVGALGMRWEQYLTDEDRILDQSGFEADLSLSAKFLPDSIVAIRPQFTYIRTNESTGGAGGESNNRDLIAPGIDFIIQPSGGRVFEQLIGYDAQIHLYEDIEGLNKHEHQLVAQTRWNFLPRTALIFQLRETINIYFDETRPINTDVGGTAFELTNENSYPLKALLGVQGLFFDRLDFKAFAGYGYTFYDVPEDENEHLGLGVVELGYRFWDDSDVRLGYLYDFQDATIGTFMKYHRIYASFGAEFAEVVPVELGVGTDFREYAPLQGSAVCGAGQTTNCISDEVREEIRVDVLASVGYHIFDGFSVFGRYQFIGNFTDFSVTITNPNNITRDELSSYAKHLVFLSLVYEY